MPLDAFAALNRRQGDAGERLFAEPAQRGGGQPAPEGPARHRVARPVVLRVPGRRSTAARRCGPSHHETLEWLRAARAPGEPAHRGARDDRRGRRLLRRIEAQRHSLGYEIDGAVVKVDDLAAARGDGAPRARRPAGRSRTSSHPKRRPRSCGDIMVSIGRTGRATPYAVMEPVFVGGSTVGSSRRSTTRTRSRARTSARATRSSCARPVT